MEVPSRRTHRESFMREKIFTKATDAKPDSGHLKQSFDRSPLENLARGKEEGNNTYGEATKFRDRAANKF